MHVPGSLWRVATHAGVMTSSDTPKRSRWQRGSHEIPRLSVVTSKAEDANGDVASDHRDAKIWRDWGFNEEHPDSALLSGVRSPRCSSRAEFKSFTDSGEIEQLKEICRHGALDANDRRSTWLSLVGIDMSSPEYVRSIKEYRVQVNSVASCPGCADLHLEHLHRFGAPYLTSSSLWHESVFDKHVLSKTGETAATQLMFAIHARFRPQVEYFPQIPDLVCILLTVLSEEETWAALSRIMAGRPRKRWSQSEPFQSHLFPLSRFEGRVFVATFIDLFKERQPVVFRHLTDYCRDSEELNATFLRWFERCFVGILPMRYIMRIMDCLLVEGAKILYRVGLTLLNESRAHIMEVCATRKKGQLSLAEVLAECFAHIGLFPDSRDAKPHPMRHSIMTKAKSKADQRRRAQSKGCQGRAVNSLLNMVRYRTKHVGKKPKAREKVKIDATRGQYECLSRNLRSINTGSTETPMARQVERKMKMQVRRGMSNISCFSMCFWLSPQNKGSCQRSFFDKRKSSTTDEPLFSSMHESGEKKHETQQEKRHFVEKKAENIRPWSPRASLERMRSASNSLRSSTLFQLFDISERNMSVDAGSTVVQTIDAAMYRLSPSIDKPGHIIGVNHHIKKEALEGEHDKKEEDEKEGECKDSDLDVEEGLDTSDKSVTPIDLNINLEDDDPVVTSPKLLKVWSDDSSATGSARRHDETLSSNDLTVGRSKRGLSGGIGSNSDLNSLNDNVIMVQNLIGTKRFYSESSMVRCSSAAGATILQHLVGEKHHSNVYKDGEAMDHFDFKVFLSEVFAWRNMKRRHLMRKDEANRKNKAVTGIISVATFTAIGHYSRKLLTDSFIVRKSEQATRLVSWLPERVRFRAGNIHVLYSTQWDGRKLSSLYDAANQSGYCANVLIITCLKPDGTEGSTLGGYSSAPFRQSDRTVGDESCFLFRLNPSGDAQMWPFAGIDEMNSDRQNMHDFGTSTDQLRSTGSRSVGYSTPRSRIRALSLAASLQNSDSHSNVSAGSFTKDDHAIEDQVELEARLNFLNCSSKSLQFGGTSEANFDKNGKFVDPEDIHNVSDEAVRKMGLVQRLAGPGLWINSGLTEGHTGWCSTYQNEPLCLQEDCATDLSNTIHRYFRIAEVEVLGIAN